MNEPEKRPRSGLRSIARLFSLYYRARDLDEDRSLVTMSDESDGALFQTGDDLIDRIQENIELRRPTLVTGPRGCGKSYCCEQAIRRAVENKKNPIAGWHFLQGNREIPREYLSEDTLVVGNDKEVKLQRALVLRRPHSDGSDVSEDLFPAIPVDKSSDYAKAKKRWDESGSWVVLYLDEINRFGDGFLDSLLSLTEEGKVVRRGREYYVPIIVVATANPPGYDVTAKKLSPPLQARIARSFRVSQPDHEVLTNVIFRQAEKNHTPPDRELKIMPGLDHLITGAVLCLWGDPRGRTSGHFFLTRETRDQLRCAALVDAPLGQAMRTLNQLVTFGPDARAVGDWFGAAVARARAEAKEGAVEVVPKHLVSTALEVLGHKVRETFNEGTEPDKTLLKERCIKLVVERLLSESTPLTNAQRIFGGSGVIASALGIEHDPALVEKVWSSLRTDVRAPTSEWTQFPSPRRHLWRMALAFAPKIGDNTDAEERWTTNILVPFGLVDPKGGLEPDDQKALLSLRRFVKEGKS